MAWWRARDMIFRAYTRWGVAITMREQIDRQIAINEREAKRREIAATMGPAEAYREDRCVRG